MVFSEYTCAKYEEILLVVASVSKAVSVNCVEIKKCLYSLYVTQFLLKLTYYCNWDKYLQIFSECVMYELTSTCNVQLLNFNNTHLCRYVFIDKEQHEKHCAESKSKSSHC